ncbi:TPA: acyltransferase, partial [Streptococcus suis]|nr:acyltransferase [Streptococcus suis]
YDMKTILKKLYYLKIIFIIQQLIERQKVKRIFCKDKIVVNIGKNAKIKIGKNVTMRSFCNIQMTDEAILKIGNNVFFNNYCSINCLNEVVVGDNTLFGESVKIYDHNHRYDSKGVKSSSYTTGSIMIGKNVWVGSNTIILKGVTIGDNSIIGSNCIIYKDIPENTLVRNKQELLFSRISD